MDAFQHESAAEAPEETKPHPPLTERQLEVLRWIAKGCHSEEIALLLKVSKNTIRDHVRQILARLGAADRRPRRRPRDARGAATVNVEAAEAVADLVRRDLAAAARPRAGSPERRPCRSCGHVARRPSRPRNPGEPRAAGVAQGAARSMVRDGAPARADQRRNDPRAASAKPTMRGSARRSPQIAIAISAPGAPPSGSTGSGRSHLRRHYFNPDHFAR